MRMLVLGAGRMGLGAVHDLASQPDVEEVTVADAEYFLSEVPANVNFTRLCVLDREPPTPNSTGITARPFSAG